MYIQTRKEKRERAREPIRITTPANSWLSQPDPSQGMGRRRALGDAPDESRLA